MLKDETKFVKDDALQSSVSKATIAAINKEDEDGMIFR